MNTRKSLMLVMLLFVCFKSYGMGGSLQSTEVGSLIRCLSIKKALPESIRILCTEEAMPAITEQLQAFGYKNGSLVPAIGLSQQADPEFISHLIASLIRVYSSYVEGDKQDSFEIVLKAYIGKLKETGNITKSQDNLINLVSISKIAQSMVHSGRWSASGLISFMFDKHFSRGKDCLLTAVRRVIRESKVPMVAMVPILIICLRERKELPGDAILGLITVELEGYLSKCHYTPEMVADFIAFGTIKSNTIIKCEHSLENDIRMLMSQLNAREPMIFELEL